MIHQVLDGLGNAIGVGRHVIMAGFIVGLFIAPLLTAAVFFGAWYWLKHPEQVQRYVRRINAYLRKVAQRFANGASVREATAPASEPFFEGTDAPRANDPPRRRPSASALKEKFEDLDRRAKAIEDFVTSEEYRLEKEFKRIDD